MTSASYHRLFMPALPAVLVVAAWGAELRPAPDPEPVAPAAAEILVIAEDWRTTYPFTARFRDDRFRDDRFRDDRFRDDRFRGPIVDLAAISFATVTLVVDRPEGRRFLTPDLSSFPPELVRQPFAAGPRDLFVVQATSPQGQTRLRAELRALGAPIRGYLPEHAYLALLSPAQHRTLAASPAVLWLGLLQPAWRVAPRLDYVIELDPYRPLRLTALFERDAFPSVAALRRAAEVEGLAVEEVAVRDRGFKVRLVGPAVAARALAAMPGCRWVERFAGYRLDNNVARTSVATATGRGGAPGPLMDVEDVWNRGLRGEGQIAAASDTGLSTGDLATLHRDFGHQGSPTNPLRVIAAYPLSPTRPASWDDDQTIPGAGHGTHVSGSLVGNGVRSGSDPATDEYPASSFAGTAPQAGFVFQSILGSGGTLDGIPVDLNTLFQTPYDDGARVHSNSWSSPVDGAYTAHSQDVDEFVWSHPDMVITFTAGNRGIDGQRQGAFCTATGDPIDGVIDDDGIGAPGTAKNNVTVGASESYRPSFVFEFPEGDCTSSDGIEQRTWGWFSDCELSTEPIFSDLMADDASGLGAFSSRGPTDDGRFKPDLVAPGIAVVSTRTEVNQGYQQWGTCAVPPALRPYYVTLGGTSMSNPLTAGAAVLARQYYEDGWHGEGNAYTNLYPLPADAFSPSAALVKATLLNGAWDMTPGQYGTGTGQEIPPDWDAGADLPNNAQGYGRVDLEASLFPGSGFGRDPGRDLEVHDVAPGLMTGQFTDYPVSVAAGTDALIVTLAWSDPYADLLAATQLVSDLDLTATSPSATVYQPNAVDRVFASPDTLNNVEQVKLTVPETGSWTVRVSGFNVPGNGEPGTTVQPYALVISGVLAAPCSSPAAPTGLAAIANGTNRIDLAWNPVPASSYSVHRSTSAGGPYRRIATGVTATSYSDTTVSGNLTYYYAVTAINDPNCESPQSAEASATAFGDCTVRPSFAGLASVAPAVTGGSCVLRLEWAAASSACPGPLVYNVYRDETPGFIPGPGNLLQACVTGTFFDDASAISGTAYSYVVRAEDATVGNGGSCQDGNEDLGTADVAGDVGGDAVSVLFADDFDGSQTPGDLWYIPPANDPLLANPYSSGSCAPAPTGSGPDFYVSDWYRPETGFCFGSSAASNDGVAPPTTNYREVNNGYLILGLPPSVGPPYADGGILLPAGATAITLTFDHDYDFESSSQHWDGGRVRLSSCPDAGCPIDPLLPSSFTDLVPVGGYPGTVTTSTFFCPPWPGVDAYVDESGGCVGATFDLTAFAGQRVWIAWNHGGDNDPSTPITDDHGWIVDNVRLEATIPNPCNAPPGPVRFLTATARDGENEVEWLNPSAGIYGSTMIRFRTDAFPADPADGTCLIDRRSPGAHDQVTHGGLTNGTTYYYAAFVDDDPLVNGCGGGVGETTAVKVVSARPFDTSGPVRWAYSTGASALAPPGIGSVFGVSNDRVLHSMATAGLGAGQWPAGWSPMAMNGPAQARPGIVPISLGGATRVAFLGSQDGRVYAVDADSGAQLWASPDLGAMVQGAPGGIYTAFGGAYDLIFAGTRNGAGPSAFHGLGLADGTVAWSFTNSVAQGGDDSAIGIISGTPSIDWADHRAYYASRRRPGGSPKTVWCVSFTDATVSLVWARDVGDVDGSPILHNGRIYVGTNAGEVHALDAAIGADVGAAPFATADGPVKGYLWPRLAVDDLIFSTTNTVWSIADDGASASLNWSVATILSPSIPLVAPGDPTAWVGGGDGKLYQVDFSGLPALTSVTLGTGSAAVGSPALDVFTQTAYVGTDAGRIYAVELPLP